MTASGNPSLQEAADRWAELALARQWVSGWVEGAIFPREMVFFLASCDAYGIDCVIESGRQDGYSTMILGEYARATGKTVVSIDYEDDRARGEACRRRLAHYPIDLRVGDAFTLIPALLRDAQGRRVALLLDGPKDWPAIAVSLAALSFRSVGLISLHNLEKGRATRAYFDRLSPKPKFYESLLIDESGAWGRLAAEERRFASEAGAHRSLEASSLGVLPVDAAEASRLAGAVAPPFGLYQPAVLAWGWRSGRDAAMQRLFTISFKAKGRWAALTRRLTG